LFLFLKKFLRVEVMTVVKQCPTLNNFSPLDCLNEESLFFDFDN